jgi:hypothetical protein
MVVFIGKLGEFINISNSPCERKLAADLRAFHLALPLGCAAHHNARLNTLVSNMEENVKQRWVEHATKNSIRFERAKTWTQRISV